MGGVSAFAGWLLEQQQAIGVEFDAFDLQGARRGAGGVLTAGAIARQAALAPHFLAWIRRRRDAVHYCVALTPTGLARDVLFIGLLRARGARVIAHIHNVSDFDGLDDSRLLRAALTLIGRWSLTVVVIAAAAVEPLRRIGVASQQIALAQRFDSPAVKHHEEGVGELRVLFAGAYGAAKGLDDLLAALSELRSTEAPPVRLIIVGGELRLGERARLESIARALGLSDTVEFNPPVPAAAMRTYYETSDVVCLPSRREGFPMALLEGMAFGLPPVATNIGGIPELVDDGVSGLLIEPGDIAALATALARLKDAQVRNRLGHAAAARAAKNGSHVIAEAWRVLYDDVQHRVAKRDS